MDTKPGFCYITVSTQQGWGYLAFLSLRIPALFFLCAEISNHFNNKLKTFLLINIKTSLTIKKIRNPNIEILNNIEYQMFKIQNLIGMLNKLVKTVLNI